jgi:hypothetical protein
MMATSRRPPPLRRRRLRLVRHRHDDARRAEVERFIRAVFARRYGADVRHFAPTLISLQDRGEIVAAAGYRSAAEAPLFLERYLPSPVEALLAPHADRRRSATASSRSVTWRPVAPAKAVG